MQTKKNAKVSTNFTKTNLQIDVAMNVIGVAVTTKINKIQNYFIVVCLKINASICKVYVVKFVIVVASL